MSSLQAKLRCIDRQLKSLLGPPQHPSGFPRDSLGFTSGFPPSGFLWDSLRVAIFQGFLIIQDVLIIRSFDLILSNQIHVNLEDKLSSAKLSS